MSIKLSRLDLMWKPLDLGSLHLQYVTNYSTFSLGALSYTQGLDSLWQPLGCSCCVCEPSFGLKQFAFSLPLTVGALQPLLILLHSFTALLLLRHSNANAVQVLLHTCSSPVHCPPWTFGHRCAAGITLPTQVCHQSHHRVALGKEAHTKVHHASFQ